MLGNDCAQEDETRRGRSRIAVNAIVSSLVRAGARDAVELFLGDQALFINSASIAAMGVVTSCRSRLTPCFHAGEGGAPVLVGCLTPLHVGPIIIMS